MVAQRAFPGATAHDALSFSVTLPRQAKTATTVMRISLVQRARSDCPGKSKYYDCDEFQGCCEVDACKVGTCPRASIPAAFITTVAAVAPPVMVTQTATSEKKSDSANSPSRPSVASSQVAVTTYFSAAPTEGGAWYTDTKIPPAPPSSITTIVTSPSSVVTGVPGTSSAAPETNSEESELSAAAKGGIIGAIGAVVLAIIIGYFMCSKQRRKLRSRDSISSFSRGGSKGSVEEEDGQPPMTANPFQPKEHSPSNNDPFRREDVLATFGEQYEEPQSRFNRVSDLSSSSKMMNHPVSPISRDQVVTHQSSAVAARFTTASSVAQEPATTQPPSAVIARSATASPDFMTRLGTATPELQGPPQQAAIAELASPGLPKVVEIHSSRSGAQKYKPYRPNTTWLYPVAETTPWYLTGTLNATEDERSCNKHVNSWSKWDTAV